MKRLTLLRSCLLAFFSMSLALGLLGTALAKPEHPHVLLLEVDGIINPVKQRLIDRAIQQAQTDEAELLIIEIDTPGGLLDSTRKIVESMLAAEVPTVVYVSPSGARAGSAGTFITAAANFAVMAPGSNIGAATPVSSTGEDLNETLADKVTNDAAALIRSIAETRGRNGDKLEETVREAASFTAMEAVDSNVVDFIAQDLEDLLAQLDGRTAETSTGVTTLSTSDLQQIRINKTFLEHFLEIISDPNVTFILLTLGGLGLVIELFNPGLIVPGVVGAIALLLAYLAIGNLPVNWAGVAFLVLAVILVILETQVSGWGVLGVGAIVSFLIGGLILFDQFGAPSPTLPPISVSVWLLVGTTSVLGIGLVFVMRWVYQSRKEGTESYRSPLLGAYGVVTTDLSPRGVVEIGSDTWTAVSEGDTVITVGESVVVTNVNGLILTVTHQSDSET